MAAPAAADLARFDGRWENVDSNTRGLTTLDIDVRGSNVTVQAFGSCQPRDCDWGRVRAHAYGPDVSSNLARSAEVVSATYDPGFAETTLVIRPAGRERLRAEVLTRFTDGSGRSNYVQVHTLRPARQEVAEDCIRFDPRRARVQQARGRWKIAVGNMWLLDFGGNRGEAEQALRVIRRYGLNKQCFVGRPDPSMEYYLVNDNSPAGSMSGEDCVGFNPGRTEVKRINGRWKIVENGHWIMDFGNNGNEARTAHAIMQRYGFSRSCFVGRPGPSMSYLRR